MKLTLPNLASLPFFEKSFDFVKVLEKMLKKYSTKVLKDSHFFKSSNEADTF